MRLKTFTLLLCILLVATSGLASSRSRKRKRMCHDSPKMLRFFPKRNSSDNENGARITKAFYFDYEFILGHKISFICEATGDPRPRITWYKDDIEIHSRPYLQITEWHISENQIKSKLEITPARQMDSELLFWLLYLTEAPLPSWKKFTKISRKEASFIQIAGKDTIQVSSKMLDFCMELLITNITLWIPTRAFTHNM